MVNIEKSLPKLCYFALVVITFSYLHSYIGLLDDEDLMHVREEVLGECIDRTNGG